MFLVKAFYARQHIARNDRCVYHLERHGVRNDCTHEIGHLGHIVLLQPNTLLPDIVDRLCFHLVVFAEFEAA